MMQTAFSKDFAFWRSSFGVNGKLTKSRKHLASFPQLKLWKASFSQLC